MVDENRPSDTVEQAFDALRQSQTPEGPSLAALERTLQAVRRAQEKPNRLPIWERIRNMNKRIKYPIAAALTLAVLAGGAYLLLGRSAGIAFADVRQQIKQAETMTMTCTMEKKGMDKPVRMKVYCKSPGLKRDEFLLEGNARIPARASTSRTATAPDAQAVVVIFDLPNKKGLTLVPEQRRAIVYDLKSLPAEERNPLEELKKAVAGEREELGDKTIGAQKAKGYRCKTEMKTTMDIWVDASAGEPLLVEYALPEGMGKITMTDFVVNPKLGDALFDTKVPEGYSVENSQIFDLSVTEDDLIKYLGLFGRFCGGVFPKSLVITPELVDHLYEAQKQRKLPKDEKLSENEGKEFVRTYFPKMMAFQMKTMQGGEFVYAGEGVKLGDKAKPILWYKAKDAKTYRVIYGDLHAEDAEKAPNRPATQPATQPAGTAGGGDGATPQQK